MASLSSFRFQRRGTWIGRNRYRGSENPQPGNYHGVQFGWVQGSLKLLKPNNLRLRRLDVETNDIVNSDETPAEQLLTRHELRRCGHQKLSRNRGSLHELHDKLLATDASYDDRFISSGGYIGLSTRGSPNPFLILRNQMRLLFHL
jgi:hypothetical protein